MEHVGWCQASQRMFTDYCMPRYIENDPTAMSRAMVNQVDQGFPALTTDWSHWSGHLTCSLCVCYNTTQWLATNLLNLRPIDQHLLNTLIAVEFACTSIAGYKHGATTFCRLYMGWLNSMVDKSFGHVWCGMGKALPQWFMMRSG